MTSTWKEKFPDRLQIVFLSIVAIIALAAALAPLVYLLRRIGVG